MDKDQFLEYHRAFCAAILAISRSKNQDYTGNDPDPFANFTAVERVGIATTEQGFLTRMMDKMQRLNSFVQSGQLAVKEESVEDTLMDMANYCILFSAFLRSKYYEAESQRFLEEHTATPR